MARLDHKNTAKYWWDRHISGLSLMRADFTSHDYAPHSHDAFVIAVTDAGGATIKSHGVADVVCPSILFVSNPAEPQSAWMGASRRWRYRSIYLTETAIASIVRDLGISGVPYFQENLFNDVDLIDGFRRLHRASEDANDSFREHELLLEVFSDLFRRYGSGHMPAECRHRDRTTADKAIELIRARHAEDLRLLDLANAVGLTSFQLIGLFKRTVGLTPHAYLIRVRLDAACRHLRQGSRLSESAVAAGFYDQSALTRHFKRWYGITPRQFADAARPRTTTRS